MEFFSKNDQMGPVFQIFFIFQLLSGGVTNLFSCTKLSVVKACAHLRGLACGYDCAWSIEIILQADRAEPLRSTSMTHFLTFFFSFVENSKFLRPTGEILKIARSEFCKNLALTAYVCQYDIFFKGFFICGKFKVRSVPLILQKM